MTAGKVFGMACLFALLVWGIVYSPTLAILIVVVVFLAWLFRQR